MHKCENSAYIHAQHKLHRLQHFHKSINDKIKNIKTLRQAFKTLNLTLDLSVATFN